MKTRFRPTALAVRLLSPQDTCRQSWPNAHFYQCATSRCKPLVSEREEKRATPSNENLTRTAIDLHRQRFFGLSE
jgi:hypothetical protein